MKTLDRGDGTVEYLEEPGAPSGSKFKTRKA